MTFLGIFKRDVDKHTVLASGQVVSDPARCVQCGICSYNCPVGIDVRAHAWQRRTGQAQSVFDVRRMCGALPRGVLRFEATDLFAKGQIMNHVIIGSGVAGIAAIEAIRALSTRAVISH